MFETSEEIAKNKLILLYLLDEIKISMTNAEICQFVLERRIMDYFSVQNCLEELVSSDLLDKYKENNFTWYKIAGPGKAMLNLFTEKIPKWMRNEALDYISTNGERLKNEFEVYSSIEKTKEGDSFVSCKIYGLDRNVMMEIGVLVPDEKFAKEISANWKENSEDIYLKVIDIMTGGEKKK